MSDATEHDEALAITIARVRTVFGSTVVARQMEGALNRLLQRAMDRNAPNPVPEIEIQGIKELVTEHLWDPAFNAITGD